MKHTPWYIAKPDTVRGQEPRIRDYMPAVRDEATGKEICVLTRTSTPAKEMNANARLIAAAPDMLEALEYLMEYHRFMKGDEDVRSPLEERARAAIEKAKGAIK